MNKQACDCVICGERTGSFEWESSFGVTDAQKERREISWSITKTAPIFSCDCQRNPEKIAAWIEKDIAAAVARAAATGES